MIQVTPFGTQATKSLRTVQLLEQARRRGLTVRFASLTEALVLYRAMIGEPSEARTIELLTAWPDAADRPVVFAYVPPDRVLNTRVGEYPWRATYIDGRPGLALFIVRPSNVLDMILTRPPDAEMRVTDVGDLPTARDAIIAKLREKDREDRGV